MALHTLSEISSKHSSAGGIDELQMGQWGCGRGFCCSLPMQLKEQPPGEERVHLGREKVKLWGSTRSFAVLKGNAS